MSNVNRGEKFGWSHLKFMPSLNFLICLITFFWEEVYTRASHWTSKVSHCQNACALYPVRCSIYTEIHIDFISSSCRHGDHIAIIPSAPAPSFAYGMKNLGNLRLLAGRSGYWKDFRRPYENTNPRLAEIMHFRNFVNNVYLADIALLR